MKTTLYLIRHGEVENPHDIYYGRLPHYGLSAHGRLQAEATAEILRSAPLSAIYSSPLLRARQTAHILLRYHPQLRVHISSLLIEVHSPYDGSPRADLAKHKWDIYAGIASAYEQPADILKRGLRFVERVLRDYPGQQIAAVSHGDVIAFLTMWAQGYPVVTKGKARHYPSPASISTFEFEDSKLARPVFSYITPSLPAKG